MKTRSHGRGMDAATALVREGGASFAACGGEGGGATSVRGEEGTPSSAAEEDFSPGRSSDLLL
jgi:hypothetical protein